MHTQAKHKNYDSSGSSESNSDYFPARNNVGGANAHLNNPTVSKSPFASRNNNAAGVNSATFAAGREILSPGQKKAGQNLVNSSTSTNKAIMIKQNQMTST
jgi:hypothetical protein